MEEPADNQKNALKSRFDSKYINKYSKETLIKGGEKYLNSNLDIQIPITFYEFESTTNGPCNRSSYLVMNEIIRNSLDTKFGFFHLRKDTCKKDLLKILKNILS